jgi:epoxyqueuosine reductase
VPTAPTVDQLRALGRAAGLDAVGVASAEPFETTRADLEERRARGLHAGMQFTYRNPVRATDARATLPSVRALVVGARSYDRALPAPPSNAGPHGRVARYAWSDHYAALRAALGEVAGTLEEQGWRAVVVADQNALVDREAAVRAGLGWYGKSANVLLPGRGSWFVLGSVLTDAPLEPTSCRVPDGCGSCRRCLDGCPTGALIGAGVVDARRCLAWLVQAEGVFPPEYREALGDRLYGCDDCQEVCPPNRIRRAPSPTDRAPSDERVEAWVPLLELLTATDEQLLELYGRWYIPRREPRYLRRNALVVLGNAGSARPPGETVVGDVLARYLRDPDPLLRAHAVWAAHRLARDDLLRLVADDGHPLVRAELAAVIGMGADP